MCVSTWVCISFTENSWDFHVNLCCPEKANNNNNNFMCFSITKKSDLAPHKTLSQFSVSYWVPFPTLFTVNGVSVALLMRSLVLCNQVLSELRRVHFTGSQGTRSNQNAVFPPSAITPPLLFTTAVQSSTFREKQEPENKHKTQTENETRERLVNQVILLCLFSFSLLMSASMKWKRFCFAVIQ